MAENPTETTENKYPSFNLDFQRYTNIRMFSVDEVRELLSKRIPNNNTTIDDNTQNNSEDKAEAIRKYKENVIREAAMKNMELFEKDPELYTNLFSLKEATKGETVVLNEGTDKERTIDKAHAQINEDKDGSLFLAIESLQPTNMSFKIYNGKLVFDPTGMSPEQLKDMLAWLDRRGLISLVNLDALKLENADQKTEEMFNLLKSETETELNQKEDFYTTQEEDDSQTVDNSSEMLNNQPASQQSLNQQTATPAPQPQENNTASAPQPQENNTSSDSYDKAIKSITKWMNKNKSKDLSYFTRFVNGYEVFTIFPTDNPNNMKDDGAIDKKGNLTLKNECKIYVKRHKNGKLEISFSTPHDKPLNDSHADIIINAYKDAGIRRIKFGTLTDANEGVMRAACARELILPIGLKLSQVKFDKMIDAAEAKQGKNNPKVTEYRYNLALEFASQLKQKGINWQDPNNKNNTDCRCIRSAIGAYNISPFRDWWEDFGLRGEYENIIKNNISGANHANGAAATIGAAEAIAKLYNVYNEALNSNGNQAIPSHMQGTVGFIVSDYCQTLTNEEKTQIRSMINGVEDASIRNLPPEIAKNIYHVLQKSEEKTAKTNIEEEFTRLVNNEFYKGNAERDAVSTFLNDAIVHANNVAEDLKDYGLPPILISRIGNPKHDFTEIKRNLSRSKNLQNMKNLAQQQR